MTIVGISAPLSWNPAAAIIKNGKFLAAVEEERFNGVKHAPRMLPTKSIEFCLSYAQTKPADVDIVALGYADPLTFYFKSLLENFKERDFIRAIREGGAFAEYLVGVERLKDWLKKQGFSCRLVFVPHHLTHASSAFRCSGFNEGAVITIDGQGENDSGSIYQGNRHDLFKLKTIGHHQSLGWVFAETTDLLGFTPHSHEGKVMALAGWGKKPLSFNKFWGVNKNGYFLKRGWNNFFWKEFGPKREKNKKITMDHKNLALMTQQFTERSGMALAKQAYEKTNCGNICLAGGVALNCNMNAKIWELPFVEKIFIQPAANDAGCAIGAALEIANSFGENADFEMKHAYWGPEYSDEEIEKALKEAKLNFVKVQNIEQKTAREIAKGKIIAWFQGRMELGPRALGNRSILAHPGLLGMKDKINKEVKHREPWRPFAPSILHEAGPDYFEKYCFHPFMTLSFKTRTEKKKNISQAIHIDGTARIQSVTKETNPKYYQLIKEFAKITGIPVLLNTSFNDAEQPLVNTPRQAIQTFASTGIDFLAIGNFVVQKPNV